MQIKAARPTLDFDPRYGSQQRARGRRRCSSRRCTANLTRRREGEAMTCAVSCCGSSGSRCCSRRRRRRRRRWTSPAAGTAFFHEDQPERIPGPSLGDYLGLPINDSARAFAEAWDASRLTVPEHQCRAHSSPYILRGPLNMRIWEERDPQTQQVVAIHVDISNFQQRRTIWMDGRPHPSPNAEHTWMGFRPAPGRATRSS